MGHAVHISVLFPIPRFGTGIDQQWALRHAAANFFDHPNGFDLGELEVKDAGVDQARIEERLCLGEIDPVDDAILFGIQGGANGFSRFGVRGHDQYRFHGEVASTRLLIV